MARMMLFDGELNNAAAAEEATETHYDFDLFVISAGSGGVRAARFSANNGAKVCYSWLYSQKILVYGATYGSELEKVDFTWKKLLQKKTDEILRLNNIYKRLLANAAVKLYEVEVRQIDGTKISYTAKHILIAIGSRAHRPNIPRHELAITSDEALSLEEFPKRAIVLGGGYIVVEFASIWRGMGATVELFFRKELPLRGFDDEMRARVARNLEGRGINLHPQTSLAELIKTDDGITVKSSHGEEFVADVVLFATVRIPNTKRLNLEYVGVELDQDGAVKVDEYSRTNILTIWAMRDATNRINLTHVALMEATCFAASASILNTVFGRKLTKADYSNVAYAIFCIPPLAVVGLSEEEAVEKAIGNILVFTSGFNPMKNIGG
ncbi:hypothetical protein N665_0742s0008 [Sinapis alba]|nr:hypothetical protein N665_0742s0008 [Sinapis alba]